MQISEVRVKLVQNRTDRLKAFCSVTFDNMFVVRDIKVIEGSDGFFVAMPSRKLTDRCPKCGFKNSLRSRFCCECGARLGDTQSRIRNASGRTKLHADVAHPINQTARSYIQGQIVDAYVQEEELAKEPGYQPQSLDDFDDDYDDYHPAPRRGPVEAPSIAAESVPEEPALAESAPTASVEPAADAVSESGSGEAWPAPASGADQPEQPRYEPSPYEQPKPFEQPAQQEQQQEKPDNDGFSAGIF